jgi:hypothetical protein
VSGKVQMDGHLLSADGQVPTGEDVEWKVFY